MFSNGLKQVAVANTCTPAFLDYHYPTDTFLRVKNGLYTFIYKRR